MSRTTLTIDDDALALAREFARRHRRSLGEAVTELVRRGARRPLETTDRNGFHVVRLSKDSPPVTAERVRKLQDEIPE